MIRLRVRQPSFLLLCAPLLLVLLACGEAFSQEAPGASPRPDVPQQAAAAGTPAPTTATTGAAAPPPQSATTAGAAAGPAPAPDGRRAESALAAFVAPRHKFSIGDAAELEADAASLAPSSSSSSAERVFTPDAQNGGGQQPQPRPAAARTYTPLTAEEKMKGSLRAAFLRPQGYAFSAFSAILTEATEEDLPHKETDDRIADGLSRFARNNATRMTRTLLGSGVYPVLFRQDPRYERSTKKGFGGRALHAASRVFVTRGDNGELQPNYSRLLGSLSASAIANVWEHSTPGRDRIGNGPTFKRFARSVGFDVLQFVLFREFLSDIF